MKDSNLSTFWPSFETAWNAHDAKAVAAHFSEDAAFKFVDGRELNGRDAVEAFYNETFARMPQDWFHRIESETKTPTGSRGFLTIRNQLDETVMSIHHDLVLAGDRIIQKLTLAQ